MAGLLGDVRWSG